MSSTARGGRRHVSDYYVIPQADIKDFLSAWLGDLQTSGHWLADRPDKAAWLDPCAGGDAKHAASYVQVIKKAFEPDVLDSCDIREDSRAANKADFLASTMTGYDVVISNPPFCDAERFILRSLDAVNGGGFVVMLLRLNFLGSVKRQEFFKTHMPEAIYVHPRRLSFTSDGKTDSIEYAHFVWRKGKSPKNSKLYFV